MGNEMEDRWIVRGVKRWGNDATTEVPVNSPESSTVYISAVIEIEGVKQAGATIFMANCDRYGWVDPARGEAEYRRVVGAARELVRWHNSQLRCGPRRVEAGDTRLTAFEAADDIISGMNDGDREGFTSSGWRESVGNMLVFGEGTDHLGDSEVLAAIEIRLKTNEGASQ
jgi:hypothetical protein